MPSEAMQALYGGDADRARSLLRPDPELDVFDAAAFGRHARLRELVAADPGQARAFSDDGFTALHLAAFAGDAAAARILVDAGADVDVVATSSFAGVPPLGTAAFVRSAPIARLLLDAGADPNGRGEGGFTALHTAAANGDDAVVRLLVERGADPALANDAGVTPLHLAAADATRRLLSR